MNEDFLDALRALLAADARFLVVEAHALAVHGVPRATGDLDIWIERSPDNVARVWTALLDFGAPLDDLALGRSDLERPDLVIQIGLPPRRIDLLTGLSGVDFDNAWVGRIPVVVGNLEVPFLGRASLITNKRATGRLKDLADLEALGEPPRDDRPES
jgi:hypothetical protein